MLLYNNIDISNKEELELAMQDLYSISQGRGYELNFVLKEEYDLLLSDKKEKEDLISTLEDINKELEKDLCGKLEELSSLQKELHDIKTENSNLKVEKEQLAKKGEEMNKQLANYSLSHGVDDSNDLKYFMVEAHALEETKRHNAPYTANRDGDKYKYRFNENGPMIDACKERLTLLDPFCDIISSTEEANHIKHIAMGYFEMKGSEVCIIQKCKVELIKL